jgi:DNA-directed RNA polymerase specialized sigma24 family protein
MRVYPGRLNDRVVGIVGTRRGRPAPAAWREERDERTDPTEMERDIETLAYIMDLSASLDAASARILLLRTTDYLTPDDIAARTGISRRTYYRRWKGIADTIRREAG